MGETMNALLLDSENEFTMRMLEKPKLVEGDDVLIRISYAGLCGTDLHIIAGKFPSAKDIVLGHEFVGTVAQKGKNVARLAEGDKVAVDPNRPCGYCDPCLAGQTHFCLTEGPRRAFGVWQHGGCAEWVVVPEDVVYPMDDSLPVKEAVLVEPISCIVRGMDNVGEIGKNQRVLIQGCGIIGLLWVTILHEKGCIDLTISDVVEGRRRLAEGLRLSPSIHVVDAAELEGVAEVFDVVVDCSGNAAAIENAFGLLRRGGKISVFSCCPTDVKVSFSPFELYRKELTIVSSFVNPRTFVRAVGLVGRLAKFGYLDFDKLGVELFALNDVRKALARLTSGEISKAVFAPW